MTRRALVLGGGGTVGIAWETGVLAGLAHAGVDVTNADLIVGTSAGSVVGAQVALGMPLDALLAAQLMPLDPTQDRPAPVDSAVLNTVLEKRAQAAESSQAFLQELGALALAAATVEEAVYVQRFELVNNLDWPAHLRVTAVEVQTGAFQVWDQTTGATLAQALASSCAVPGIFPPVTIQGRRYMDGGMRSDTNAELAQGYEQVLIVMPIAAQNSPLTPIKRDRIGREIALLEANNSRVEVIAPDDETLQVFGPNLMDTTRRIEAAQAGLRQGVGMAATVGTHWNG